MARKLSDALGKNYEPKPYDKPHKEVHLAATTSPLVKRALERVHNRPDKCEVCRDGPAVLQKSPLDPWTCGFPDCEAKGRQMVTNDITKNDFEHMDNEALMKHHARLFELAGQGHGDSDLASYGKKVGAEIQKRTGLIPRTHTDLDPGHKHRIAQPKPVLPKMPTESCPSCGVQNDSSGYISDKHKCNARHDNKPRFACHDCKWQGENHRTPDEKWDHNFHHRKATGHDVDESDEFEDRGHHCSDDNHREGSPRFSCKMCGDSFHKLKVHGDPMVNTLAEKLGKKVAFPGHCDPEDGCAQCAAEIEQYGKNELNEAGICHICQDGGHGYCRGTGCVCGCSKPKTPSNTLKGLLTVNDKEYECPSCKGEGSFEEWSNRGCAPGEEKFKSTKCHCCNKQGTVPECTGCLGEPPHAEHHDEDGSCHAPDGSDYDDRRRDDNSLAAKLGKNAFTCPSCSKGEDGAFGYAKGKKVCYKCSNKAEAKETKRVEENADFSEKFVCAPCKAPLASQLEAEQHEGKGHHVIYPKSQQPAFLHDTCNACDRLIQPHETPQTISGHVGGYCRDCERESGDALGKNKKGCDCRQYKNEGFCEHMEHNTLAEKLGKNDAVDDTIGQFDARKAAAAKAKSQQQKAGMEALDAKLSGRNTLKAALGKNAAPFQDLSCPNCNGTQVLKNHAPNQEAYKCFGCKVLFDRPAGNTLATTLGKNGTYCQGCDHKITDYEDAKKPGERRKPGGYWSLPAVGKVPLCRDCAVKGGLPESPLHPV